MKRIKKFVIKHKIATIIFSLLLFAVAIPYLINMAFKSNWGISWLQAEWEAGDALAFAGTILGTIATILGVYLSIEHAQKSYRQDEINRVKPYFALTHYNTKAKVNFLSLIHNNLTNEQNNDKEDAENGSYEEYRLDKIFIIIDKERISFQSDLTPQQKQMLKNDGNYCKQTTAVSRTLYARHLVSMPFDMENVGNGAAVNTMVGLYRKGSEFSGLRIDTMKCGQSAYLHIYSEIIDNSMYGDYVLEIVYYDILGHNYSQKYDVSLLRDEETGTLGDTINLEGKQELLEG